MSEKSCFHCHLPINGPVQFTALIDGEDRPMCCPGCQAVATAIVSGGLDNYYRYRSEPAQQADLSQALKAEYKLYDREDLQQSFIRSLPSSRSSHSPQQKYEARLLIEGITCSACVWLLEHHISSIKGVESVTVNLSQHTATVTFISDTVKISEIMLAVLAVGYRAHPWRQEQQDALLEKEHKQFIRRLAVASIGTMQVMMYAIAMYAGGSQGMESEFRTLMRWVSALIATPVVFYSARPFFSAAWRDIKNRHPGMDVPVSIAIGGAYLASLWGTIQGTGEVYFDSVSMFTLFLLSGRFLEMRARHHTNQTSRSLHLLLPESCLRVNKDGNTERVSPSDLQVGDNIRILTGENIPADGTILNGQSSINESALTGEYLPVAKHIGDQVTAGTINTENAIEVEVTHVGQNTRLSAIARLLEQAQGDKPTIARQADRVAGWFVCTVLIASVGVYFYWLQHEPDDAFWIVLSVLVATCPCALSLATPAALTAVTGFLQSKGMLISHSRVLEGLPQITHVIFDKTGTLTQGDLSLTSVKILNKTYSRSELLDVAAALESHSEHPIAHAFPASTTPVKDVENITAQGLQGRIAGHTWRIGKPSFVSPGMEASPPDNHLTWLLLSCDKMPLAWFGLDDTLRPEAKQIISELTTKGLQVGLLSGDNQGVVNRVGKELGIESCHAQATPDDKLGYVQQLQAQGNRVLMIGDGVNDIPVLAAADLSVAMNTASDLARTHADALLLSGDLNQLLTSIDKACDTRRIIRENMTWALGYNLLVLPLAASGWLAPWMAAIGMSASSLVVVGNALRLSKPPKQDRATHGE
ncbi:heavy metal translocating P-type ATPase [Parendozoicomonas sp. Alg238-R29]|uniref:heavy metal translocating P-type ATPase n=1 Tax=Parendozoicomonas sp. Alg238-R29 TaxID=2993446 RepID=UPI00248DC5AC|nr:heavy metal translocating P-type ATPase [Parendozoicomonas sp. Alg238-R29]